MKVSLLVLFVIAAIVEGLDVRGHGNMDEPIKGDVRILSPRFLRSSELGFAVLDLSRQANVPAGFESTLDCWLSPAPISTPLVTEISSRIDAFDGHVDA